MIKSLIDLCFTASVDYRKQKVRFQIRGNKMEIFGNKDFKKVFNLVKRFGNYISFSLFIRFPQPHHLPPDPHLHRHNLPRRDIVQVPPPLNQ